MKKNNNINTNINKKKNSPTTTNQESIKSINIKFNTFVYITILITLILFIFLYTQLLKNTNILNKFTNTSNPSDTIEAYQPDGLQISNIDISADEITNSRFISNYKNIKILNLEIDTSSKLSTIKITFYNNSNKTISNKKMYISLFNKNKKSIFGSSIAMPTIKPYSKTYFNIQCTDKLTDYFDYDIKIIK